MATITMTRWWVGIEEMGLGQGDYVLATDWRAAAREYAHLQGRTMPPGWDAEFRDVNGDGTRFEEEDWGYDVEGERRVFVIQRADA